MQHIIEFQKNMRSIKSIVFIAAYLKINLIMLCGNDTSKVNFDECFEKQIKYSFQFFFIFNKGEKDRIGIVKSNQHSRVFVLSYITRLRIAQLCFQSLNHLCIRLYLFLFPKSRGPVEFESPSYLLIIGYLLTPSRKQN